MKKVTDPALLEQLESGSSIEQAPGKKVTNPLILSQLESDSTQTRPGLMQRGWDALSVPEKMSREGLGAMASMVPKPEPTGNRLLDIAKGTPRIAADTLAEVAPSFVSRGSIATAGGLKGIKLANPILKAAGRGVAKAAESVSGLEYKTPGVLKEAYKDASLIFGKGMEKAGALFKELVEKGRIRQSFARATSSKDLLDEALKAIDDGSLTAEEALVSRQTLDGIKKTLPRFSFNQMQDLFDRSAKTISTQADAAFSRAVKSDALRLILPVNKSGGTSIAKGVLGSVAGVGPLIGMSPVVQGTAATAAGLVGRKVVAPLAKNALRSGVSIGAARKILRKEKK